MIHNSVINDSRLGWKEKGIMIYALSKKEGWSFYISEMEKHAPDGIRSLKSGLKNLEKFGYLFRIRRHDSLGRFQKIDWHFFEDPAEKEAFESEYNKKQEQKKTHFPQRNKPKKHDSKKDNHQCGFATVAKCHTNNTNSLNKTKKNNNNNNKKKISPKDSLVPLSPPAHALSPSASAVVVFSFLDKFNLTDKVKQKLCKEHSEEKLLKTCERVERWETRKSDGAAFMKVLRDFDTWDDTPKRLSKEEQEKEAYKKKLEQEEQERAEKHKQILNKKAQDEARAEENRQWFKQFASEHKTFFDQDNRFEVKENFVKAYYCDNGDRYSPVLPFSDQEFQKYAKQSHENMKSALKCELLTNV